MTGAALDTTPGRTVTEPATAHATTTIVPLAIPLKMSEPHARPCCPGVCQRSLQRGGIVCAARV
jgi:hypothetical protein